VAVLWVEFERASADVSLSQRTREVGKGRRPSIGQMDRLAHRLQVASREYGDALQALLDNPEVRWDSPLRPAA
jgi:hypothetical protein